MPIPIPGDITDSKYTLVLIAKAADYGDNKIHILMNTAGYT